MVDQWSVASGQARRVFGKWKTYKTFIVPISR
jgi:hypothetical protein